MKTKLCKTILGLFVFVAIFSSTVFAEVKFSFAFPSEYVPDQILVRFSPKSDGSQKDKTEKDQFLASLNAGEVKHSFKRVPGLTVVKLPNGLSVQEALSKLKNKNEILYAEPDSIIYPDSITPNDPYFKQQWALNNTGQTCGTPGASIHAPESWDLIHDANDSIIIAVIDTGIDYTHPDISANMWNGNPYHGYDFSTMNGKQRDSDPMDDYLHGTHVAGIIGAKGNNDIGIAGVCWSTKIMALKFMIPWYNGNYWVCTGRTSDAIDAIEYAVDNGAKILNCSWGIPDANQALRNEIQAADVNGVLFIASSGDGDAFNIPENIEPGRHPHYPASFDCQNIISVMATNSFDLPASYSNYGPISVDLAAPGGENKKSCLSILSTFPTYWTNAMNSPFNHYFDTNYESIQGTSMAAPYVSGACALVWSKYPYLSHLQVKDVIMKSVDPLCSLDNKCVTEGRLNLYNALTWPLTITDNFSPCNPVPLGQNVTLTLTCRAYNQQFSNLMLVCSLPPGVTYYQSDATSHTASSATWNNISVGQNETVNKSLTVTVTSSAAPGYIEFPCTLTGGGLNFTKSHKQRIKGRIRNLNQPTQTPSSLQDAVNLADNNDTIELDAGTYNENIFIGYYTPHNLTIKSTNPADRSVVANTIIDGTGTYAFDTDWDANANFTLSGLTMRNSSTDDVVYASGSTVNILNCKIYSQEGTGVYLEDSSDGTITGCEIFAKKSVYTVNSNASIDGCFLEGGEYGVRSSILNESRNVTVRNCRVENCSANGIYASGVALNAYGNRIRGSTSTTGAGIYLYNPSADCQIYDNLIYQNNTGINVSNSRGYDITLRNNTVVDNSTKGILLSYNLNKMPIMNSIVWNNGSEITASANVTYSCIKGGYAGGTNIIDPLSGPGFADAANHDYHILSDSPCKDIGTNNGILSGETDIDGDLRQYNGTAVDMGADEFALTDWTTFAPFANAWHARPADEDTRWNAACDYVVDRYIDFHDLKIFAANWLLPTGWKGTFAGIGYYESETGGEQSMMQSGHEQ